MPWLDALKAIACLSIVSHHLAVYGPMSDLVYPLFPRLIDWLYTYGRMAVQVFLVLAGFLAAQHFAPDGIARDIRPVRAIAHRYFRLVIPFLAAMALAMICSALARIWMSNDSIPDAPHFSQMVAHVFLVQDLLDIDVLSAGVWYISIDFQLFALTTIIFWLAARAEARRAGLAVIAPLLIAALMLASLFIFNRNDALDDVAIYFFGCYGLGVLSFWASHQRRGARYLACLALAVLAALTVDFRTRVAIAGVVALAIGVAHYHRKLQQWQVPQPLIALGRISYSIFLVHFPLCLLVNAAFFHFFPNQPLAQIFGLVLALCISVLGGAIFFKYVESRRFTVRTRLVVLAAFAMSGGFAMLARAA